MRNAPRSRVIHTFLATSALHLKHKLKISPEEALRQAVAAVTLARTLAPDVEFSAEDASRTDYGFLREVLQAVFEAGAARPQRPRHRRLLAAGRVRGDGAQAACATFPTP